MVSQGETGYLVGMAGGKTRLTIRIDVFIVGSHGIPQILVLPFFRFLWHGGKYDDTNVDSCVIELDLTQKGDYEILDEKIFFKMEENQIDG